MKKSLIFLSLFLLTIDIYSQTIGFFNIRRLGDVQKDYDAVASIVRNYDVCGIVEVMNENGLKKLVYSLGEDWNYLISEKDVGRTRYKEYYGIVWNTKFAKVRSIGFYSDPLDAFERDPYAYVVESKDKTFLYVLNHIIFGDSIRQRRAEVSSLPSVADEFEARTNNQLPLIIAGDFNLDNSRNDFSAVIWKGFVFAQSEKTSLGRTGLANSYDHFLFSRRIYDSIDRVGVTNPISPVSPHPTGSFSFSYYSENISDHLPIYFIFK